MTDARRQQPITITWLHSKTAHLLIDGLRWSEVEWSAKQQAWCIQDAAGRCLHHHSRIHDQASDKEGAIELAQEMIRDGRLPTPEEAEHAESERLRAARERRAKQPSEIRRKQEREARNALWREHCDLKYRQDRQLEPYWSLLADVFDLADPDLWKRNSFAPLREKLILSLKVEITDIEHRRRTMPAKIKERLERAKSLLALIDGGER
jgi:hypothetical protein